MLAVNGPNGTFALHFLMAIVVNHVKSMEVNFVPIFAST
jgi:hypothetical protein